MKSDNINNFYKGWFIGHFKDAMLDSLNFEAGVKYFKSGESNPPHVHKRHKEINFVFSGKVSFNDIVFLPGSIVIVEEGECVVRKYPFLVVVRLVAGSVAGRAWGRIGDDRI